MPTNYHTDSFGQGRAVSINVTKERSPIATWALRLAWPFFVPVMPFIGACAGFIALGDMKRNAARTGRGRAKLAIMLGLSFTAVQALVGWAGWQYAESAQHAPRQALARANGDGAAFLAHFDSAAPESQAEAFLELVNDRYGDCRDVDLDLPSNWYTKWAPFKPFTYEAQFAQGTIKATAQVVVNPGLDPDSWQPRLAFITLHDAKQGDLRFPPDARTAAALRAMATAGVPRD